MATEEHNSNLKAMMAGDMTTGKRINNRVFQVYVSSTVGSRKVERNYLMTEIYPQLRQFCEDRGLQFNLVDMKWGIDDLTTNDHTNSEIILKELDRCCNSSVMGSCFVFLFGNKRSWHPLPRRVKANEFEDILEELLDQESKDLTLNWYKKDTNAIPAEYVLQPIYKQNYGIDREMCQERWKLEEVQLSKVLRTAVLSSTRLSLEQKKQWHESMLEKEIRLFVHNNANVDKNCIVFTNDLDKEHHSFDGKPWHGFINLDQVNRDVLVSLLDKQSLKGRNSIPNIQCDNHKSHTNHIRQFGEQLSNSIIDMIKDAIQTSPNIDDTTYEVANHEKNCAKRANEFYGRADLVNKGLNYFRRQETDKSICVLHGIRGSGKTSLMSYLAVKAQTVLKEEKSISPVTIVRYCGLTTKSSNAYSLMESICCQIANAYGYDPPQRIFNYNSLICVFHAYLALATEEQPLILFIDSLDQLNDDDQGRSNLKWINEFSPPHLYTVVSVAEKGTSLESLLAKVIPKDNFIRIPQIFPEDISDILNAYLQSSKRQLTFKQYNWIWNAALDESKQEPTALRLRMLSDIAMRCHSYEDLENLPLTTAELIDSYLQFLESEHGKKLVSTLVAVLNCSLHGLSENELIDMVSCSDGVFQDVSAKKEMVYRRVLPLAWARLKNDLTKYITEVWDNNRLIWSWVNQEFEDVVRERYSLSSSTKPADLLFRYFSGEIASDQAYQKCMISSQPLFRKSMEDDRVFFNTKKLLDLPSYALQSENPLRVENILIDFTFIAAKLESGLGYDLMLDYRKALKKVRSCKLEQLCPFVASEIDLLDSQPLYLIQQAVNCASGGFVSLQGLSLIDKTSLVFPWIAHVKDQKIVKFINKPTEIQRCVMTLTDSCEKIDSLRFWKEKYLFCLIARSKMQIWNLPLNRLCETISLKAEIDEFQLISPSYNMRIEKQETIYMACGSMDGSICIWEIIIDDAVHHSLLRSWNAHRMPLISISIAFAQKECGKLATGIHLTNQSSGRTCGEMKLWDLRGYLTSQLAEPLLINHTKTQEVIVCGQGTGIKYGVRSLQFILSDRFLMIGLVYFQFGMLSVRRVPDLKLLWTLKDSQKEFDITKVDIYEDSTDVAFVLVSTKLSIGILRLVSKTGQDFKAHIIYRINIPHVLAAWSIKKEQILLLENNNVKAYSRLDTKAMDNLFLSSPNVEEWQADASLPCLDMKNQSTLVGHSSKIEAIANNSKLAATGSIDGIIKVWQVCNINSHDMQHSSPILFCTMIPDRSFSVACSKDSPESIKLWDLESGKLLKEYEGQSMECLVYSNDNSKVLVSSTPTFLAKISILPKESFERHLSNVGYPDFSGGTQINLPISRVMSASFSNNGKYIWIRERWRYQILVVNLETRKWVNVPKEHKGITYSYSEGATFVNDSKTLIVWGSAVDRKAHAWRTMVFHWSLESRLPWKGLFPEPSCCMRVVCDTLHNLSSEKFRKTKAGSWNKATEIEPGICFSTASALNDPMFIVFGTTKGLLQIRHVDTMNIQQEIMAHRKSINAIKLTTGGKYLVTCSDDGWLHIWDSSNFDHTGGFYNSVPITSFDIILKESGKYIVNMGDTKGQFKVLEFE